MICSRGNTVICDISTSLNGARHHEKTPHKINIVDLKGKKHTVVYTIKNISNDVIRFQEYWHGYKRKLVRVTTSDQFGVKDGTAHPLKTGGKEGLSSAVTYFS